MKRTRKNKGLRSGKRNGGAQVVTAPSTGIAPVTGWLVPTLIVLLTGAAFFPALENGFVNWDDDRNLLENPNYRGLGWTQLRWMFTTLHLANYRPLTWMTLGFDYILWGMDPFGYHLTSLLLHAATALLFYFLTLRLLSLALSISAVSADVSLRVAAGLAALIFSLHPLRVEAVAWASARNHVLSGLFFLLTILYYLRAATCVEVSAARWRWLTLSVIAYSLSLLSQPIGMTLPFILLVLDVYPLRRLGGGLERFNLEAFDRAQPRAHLERWFGATVRRVWWEKVPFLFLALGAGVIGLLAKEEAMYSFEEVGVLPRLAQALYGLAFYLWKTVLPLGLSPLYQLPIHLDLWAWPLLLSGLVVLVVSMGLFIVRHRWPAGLASWIGYVLILSPVLGVAQSSKIVADRYSYLSCLGWAVLAGVGLSYCWRYWASGRVGRRTFMLVIGLSVGVVVGLGSLTWKQAQVWHDSETLWRHALDVGQKTTFAHDNLGIALFDRGALEEAIGHFRQALQINPAHAKAHNNLGNALFVRGELGEAIDHLRQALKINPAYAKAHYNLGVALARRGELEEAIEHFRQAVQIDPAYAKAHYNLGIALARRGELEEAIEHFRQALRHQPELAEAHESLGRALAQQGKRDEAIQHYQEALQIMKSRRRVQGSR